MYRKAVSDNVDDLITALEKLFDEDLMKSDPNKCHLLVSSCEKIKRKKRNFQIKNSTCEKLLGVHSENRLNFDLHIIGLCKKN